MSTEVIHTCYGSITVDTELNEISNFLVAKPYLGRGLGGYLLRKAEGLLKSTGEDVMRLFAFPFVGGMDPEDLASWYERQGYIPIELNALGEMFMKKDISRQLYGERLTCPVCGSTGECLNPPSYRELRATHTD